jgi:hypothetical protein
MKTINNRRPGLSAILLSALLLLLLSSAKGQVTTLRLELYNHQIWIKVGLNGTHADSLSFIFDSGAGTSLLDSAVEARLFPGKHLNQMSATGAGGKSIMKQLTNESLYLNGLKLDNVNFLVSDLGRLTGRMGRKLDGIVGYDLLKKYVTRIDIDHKTLSIYQEIKDVNAEKGKPLVFDFSPEIPFLPRLQCSFTTLAGQTYTGYFIFDSGAGITALLNTPFVNQNELLMHSGKTINLKSEGLTNASDKYSARIVSFSFNGEIFKDLPISMSQTTAGVNAMKGYAGLIGNELLFRYNLTFDYSHKAIYLQPNSHYATPFIFPLHGFTLKAHNGSIYIDNIATGSPEMEMGLEEGSQLISVNGRTGLAIEEIRKLLEHEGKIILMVKQKSGDKQFVIPLYPRI